MSAELTSVHSQQYVEYSWKLNWVGVRSCRMLGNFLYQERQKVWIDAKIIQNNILHIRIKPRAAGIAVMCCRILVCRDRNSRTMRDLYLHPLHSGLDYSSSAVISQAAFQYRGRVLRGHNNEDIVDAACNETALIAQWASIVEMCSANIPENSLEGRVPVHIRLT